MVSFLPPPTSVDGVTIQSVSGTLSVKSPHREQDHFSAGFVDQSGSRAKTTIYQAGASAARFVATSWTTSAATTIAKLECSPDQVTWSELERQGRPVSTADGVTVMGLVPPSWYYRVVEVAVTLTLTKWWEVDL